MTPINYSIGDASLPDKGASPRIIAHICNDEGGWGAGFVLALSRRSNLPEVYYRRWQKEGKPVPFSGGHLIIAPYMDDMLVANMIAQHGCGPDAQGTPPIRYTWLINCLIRLRAIAREMNASVHMPRIGCGLAGGTWDKVEIAVEFCLSRYDIPVFVYDL
jgi:O-acetyl-ADP-ribose deacetylase (regulator of RNase III)